MEYEAESSGVASDVHVGGTERLRAVRVECQCLVWCYLLNPKHSDIDITYHKI